MMRNKLKKIFFPGKQPYQREMGDKALVIPEFEEFIALVLAIPEEKFYNNALQEDPIYNRMTESLKAELIAEAKACGKKFADLSLQKAKTIDGLLRKSQIHFSNPLMPNGGNYVIFAQYTEPNNITVFQDSLNQFLELVKKTKYKTIFTEKVVKELLIAHEYFHYLEYQNEATIITKTKKMQLWRFFNYRYMTKFISLSEMSAMVFAKEYQSFSYSPFILDCLLTYAYNKELSYNIYRNILESNTIERQNEK